MDKLVRALQQWQEQLFRHSIHRVSGSEQAQRCPHCRRFTKGVYSRRQNTRYVDEESNWVTCCAECYEEIEAHWADQWVEYYSMVL